MTDKILEVKKRIAIKETVRYQGTEYLPKCLVYWYDERADEWRYSAELVDTTHKNSVVRVGLEKIEL